jgi:ABC-type dipeptide/oligopeptide/nickel transport system permease component
MLYPLVMQTFDFEINRNVEMMLSFFSAYMVQRRPIRSQVQTLMYGIIRSNFGYSFTPLPSVTQLALAPIRNTTTIITTSYQHMPMLLALSTRAMLREM